MHEVMDKTLTASPCTTLMDYPKMDYPSKKILFQISDMLRSCDYVSTQHERCFSFLSAFVRL